MHKQLDESIASEERALRRQWPRRMRQYEGQYVALYQGRVIDHDSDDEALAGRLFGKLGDVPFYIAHIEKEPAPFELPSPEIPARPTPNQL